MQASLRHTTSSSSSTGEQQHVQRILHPEETPKTALPKTRFSSAMQ
jgi:hypothetical protein